MTLASRGLIAQPARRRAKLEPVLSVTTRMRKREYGSAGSLDMEQAMRRSGLDGLGFGRVVIIAGATAAAMTALLFAKPFYSATTEPKAATSAGLNRPVADQEPKAETVSFVASPTIDANPQFFFGCGDGSNGYYAERPEPTLVLVRYERMP
jgi:hypothetical protein